MDPVANIRTNLQRVNEKIALAANRSRRNRDNVKLVVVSKGQPVEVIKAAVAAGVRIFGENYPEESLAKIEASAGADLSWHMIGHLQSRKARIVTNHFQMMHSLDSVSLAEKMERQLTEVGRILPVLLEFNVGGEESKSGWLAAEEESWPGLLNEVGAILQLPHILVLGLMTMPPLTTAPEVARGYFQRLVALQGYFRSQFPNVCWDELSMGTSSDFEVAVEEGATYVRIGSAILGPRPPKGQVDTINH